MSEVRWTLSSFSHCTHAIFKPVFTVLNLQYTRLAQNLHFTYVHRAILFEAHSKAVCSMWRCSWFLSNFYVRLQDSGHCLIKAFWRNHKTWLSVFVPLSSMKPLIDYINCKPCLLRALSNNAAGLCHKNVVVVGKSKKIATWMSNSYTTCMACT